jgi:hypothetical protein
MFTGNTDPNPALKEKIDDSERFDAFDVAASRFASFASREGTRRPPTYKASARQMVES